MINNVLIRQKKTCKSSLFIIIEEETLGQRGCHKNAEAQVYYLEKQKLKLHKGPQKRKARVAMMPMWRAAIVWAWQRTVTISALSERCAVLAADSQPKPSQRNGNEILHAGIPLVGYASAPYLWQSSLSMVENPVGGMPLHPVGERGGK